MGYSVAGDVARNQALGHGSPLLMLFSDPVCASRAIGQIA